jgi:hypothetical protein
MDFLIHRRPFLGDIRLLYIELEGNMAHIFCLEGWTWRR